MTKKQKIGIIVSSSFGAMAVVGASVGIATAVQFAPKKKPSDNVQDQNQLDQKQVNDISKAVNDVLNQFKDKNVQEEAIQQQIKTEVQNKLNGLGLQDKVVDVEVKVNSNPNKNQDVVKVIIKFKPDLNIDNSINDTNTNTKVENQQIIVSKDMSINGDAGKPNDNDHQGETGDAGQGGTGTGDAGGHENDGSHEAPVKTPLSQEQINKVNDVIDQIINNPSHPITKQDLDNNAHKQAIENAIKQALEKNNIPNIKDVTITVGNTTDDKTSINVNVSFDDKTEINGNSNSSITIDKDTNTITKTLDVNNKPTVAPAPVDPDANKPGTEGGEAGQGDQPSHDGNQDVPSNPKVTIDQAQVDKINEAIDKIINNPGHPITNQDLENQEYKKQIIDAIKKALTDAGVDNVKDVTITTDSVTDGKVNIDVTVSFNDNTEFGTDVTDKDGIKVNKETHTVTKTLEINDKPVVVPDPEPVDPNAGKPGTGGEGESGQGGQGGSGEHQNNDSHQVPSKVTISLGKLKVINGELNNLFNDNGHRPITKQDLDNESDKNKIVDAIKKIFESNGFPVSSITKVEFTYANGSTETKSIVNVVISFNGNQVQIEDGSSNYLETLTVDKNAHTITKTLEINNVPATEGGSGTDTDSGHADSDGSGNTGGGAVEGGGSSGPSPIPPVTPEQLDEPTVTKFEITSEMLKTINDGITKIFTEGNGHGPITKQDVDENSFAITSAINSLVLKTVGLPKNPLVGVLLIPSNVTDGNCNCKIGLNFNKDKVTLSNENVPEGCTIDVENCSVTRTISIPESLYVVKDSVLIGLTDAGKKVTSLKINLPDVTGIDQNAFNGSAATEIDLSNMGVTNLAANSFSKCNGLTGIKLGASVTTIDKEAFKDCNKLKTFDCSSATSLDQQNFLNAFDGLNPSRGNIKRNVDDIKLPSNWDNIGNIYSELHSLLAGSHLTTTALKLTLPNDCEIPAYYFNECGIIFSVDAKNVKKIGDCAFLHSSINAFTCDCTTSTITEIGANAFDTCQYLTRVDLLTKESKVTNIGSSAFAHCENLKNVNFPSNISHIGTQAFMLSTLEAPKNERFSIPASCIIDADAFDQTILLDYDGHYINYPVVDLTDKEGNSNIGIGNDPLFGPRP